MPYWNRTDLKYFGIFKVHFGAEYLHSVIDYCRLNPQLFFVPEILVSHFQGQKWEQIQLLKVNKVLLRVLVHCY